MKKGISLIVLVITIIVMIIIAGAIILSLNSSNVTNKANWAQVSADRANLQSELAVILADTIAEQKIGQEGQQDYLGVTVGDVQRNSKYTTWASKVENTNTRFAIYVPAAAEGEEESTDPAAMKVVMIISEKEAASFGLTVNSDKTVIGYDWVKVGTPSTVVGDVLNATTF